MAKEASTEQKIESLIAPVFEDGKYELVDVEFVKEGPSWFLRIFIDCDGRVSLDDCEAVSRAVEKILDEKDPISQPYVLEVSSPGIDRPLKKELDFVKYKGSLVDVKLYKGISGRKEFQGELVGLIDGNIVIEAEKGETLSFPKKEVANIRLAVVF